MPVMPYRALLTNIRRQAHALNPKDDSVRFNISLIQQKGLELLQGLPSAKRRISEIQTALADAEAAQEY